MDLVTLRRKTGKTLFAMNHCIIFLDPSPSVMKTKINKRDLIKLKSFCSTKETINKMKRQSTEWEKIYGKKATYTGLISKIHKQLMQLNIKKNPNQKMAKGQNRHFSKKDIQMAKKHMKRSSISLITTEMQITTIVMYHLTPVRKPIIKPTNNKCWTGCREKGTLLYCWWECNLVQSLQRRVERLKLVLLYDSEISFLDIYPEKTVIQKDTCTPIFTASLLTTAKTWKQPKCPLTEEWKKKMWYTYRMEYYSAI